MLRNGQVTTIPVEIGDSSDSQTVITSGLSEGETVITGSASTSNSSTSPFSGFRLGGFGGGGGGARTVIRGG